MLIGSEALDVGPIEVFVVLFLMAVLSPFCLLLLFWFNAVFVDGGGGGA